MKKKIAVITVHDFNGNFGSTIQACSLCEYLNELGHEPFLINYIPESLSGFPRIRKKLLDLAKYPLRASRFIRFRRYWKPRISLSQRYSTFNELKAHPPQADIYMVGSDQVWNNFYPCGKDGAYYLEFIDSSEKYAYSASLGSLFPPEDLENLQRKLTGFKRISVRERASSEQLKSVGVKAEYTLDPIFLYDRTHYLQNCPPLPKNFGNYLLVYGIYDTSDNDMLFKMAQRYANKHGLKTIGVGYCTRHYPYDHHLYTPGPHDFIRLIQEADFVLTHSFHGIAFSILLNTRFGCLEPTVSSLRIRNILETAGLESRMVSSMAEMEHFEASIDFSLVNQKIETMRQYSRNYLQEILA